MRTVLYIGSSDDLQPLINCPEVKRFIYIDPCNITYLKLRIRRDAENRGLKIVDVKWAKQEGEESIIRFDTNQIIQFYHTSFPERLTEKQLKEVEECTDLWIVGFYPPLKGYVYFLNIKQIYTQEKVLNYLECWNDKETPYVDLQSWFPEATIKIVKHDKFYHMKYL